MRRFLPVLALAAALSACATAPTVYQPIGPNGVGYSDFRIEPDRFRVIFQGGPGAPPAQVEDYALLRAADLALAGGYDWFRVVDRVTHATGYSGSSISFGVGGASYGSHSAAGVGVSSGFPVSGGTSAATNLEVVMGRGPHPQGLDVYDAHAVRASVGGRI